MLRRSLHRGVEPQLCGICEFVQARQLRPAKRSFVTLNIGNSHGAKIFQDQTRSINTGLLATARTFPRVKQVSSLRNWKSLNDVASARAGSTNSSRFKRDESSNEQEEDKTNTHQVKTRPQPDLANPAELVAAVERVTRLFLAQQGIPSEKTALTALRACTNAYTRLVADEQQQPEEARPESQSETTASHLLDLDKNGRKAAATARAARPLSATRNQNVVDTISDAAYAIITHPAVIITPRLLDEYIRLQAGLYKPETLPQVLALYASKPRPKLAAGKIQYTMQNPDRADHAIEAATAETALDAAIEAKNLDAAIGIIENSYATKAFIRSKMLKSAIIPGTALALAPIAAYTIATGLSSVQTSMDSSMATNIAFAGILAYLGFTATIGVVVVTTANDQMKRVTWAPGTPLRQRWIREDERAALDRVACSFGFSESHRYGEEEGAEFHNLREYIMRKGMILDAVELMEGMA